MFCFHHLPFTLDNEDHEAAIRGAGKVRVKGPSSSYSRCFSKQSRLQKPLRHHSLNFGFPSIFSIWILRSWLPHPIHNTIFPVSVISRVSENLQLSGFQGSCVGVISSSGLQKSHSGKNTTSSTKIARHQRRLIKTPLPRFRASLYTQNTVINLTTLLTYLSLV